MTPKYNILTQWYVDLKRTTKLREGILLLYEQYCVEYVFFFKDLHILPKELYIRGEKTLVSRFFERIILQIKNGWLSFDK